MKERKVILNDRGIMFFIVLILSLTFTLGFMTSKAIESKKSMAFSENEIEQMITLRNMMKQFDEEIEVYITRDSDGNLLVGNKPVEVKKSLFSKSE